jgi:hypothetical protein
MSFTAVQQRALDIYTGQYMRISNQIERLYMMIDDIRNNIMSTTNSQHRLLNVLVAQSDRVFTQIEGLYNMLDEIRDNISHIIQEQEANRPIQQTHSHLQRPRQETNRPHSQSQRTRHNNTSSTRLNSVFENIRPRVVYDYRSPISPIEYLNTDTNTNRTTNTNRSTFGSQISDILSSFLNTSVTVRPTVEQLDAASRLVRYGDIERPLSESCPISLDRFNIDDLVRQIHHCGHLFVPSQFDEWFQSNVRCPVCRFDVRNHVRDQNRGRPSIDPSNNEIVVDLSGNEITDNLLNRLFGTNVDNNDRLVYDPSNNILMYETIIRRNTDHR